MKRVRILFLAANPAATQRLTLDDEAREIQAKIYAAEHRDDFELITQWAVRPDDLLDAFNRYRPHVVHFSGHGNESDELILAGDDGQPRPVAKPALARLFRVLGQDVRVVVLNACYSRPQAEVIAEHVDCVVGMQRAIEDRACVRFAASFYRALAFGRSVANAFDQGLVSLDIEGTGASEIPDLVVRRPSVNPADIVLVPDDDELTTTVSTPPKTAPHKRPPTTSHKPGSSTEPGTAPPPRFPTTPSTWPAAATPPRPAAAAPPQPTAAPPAVDDGGQPSSDTLPLWITTASSHEAALQALLVNAFDGNPDGLLAWVRIALGPAIHNELPSRGGLAHLAHQTMLAAGRHGRIDAAMFHSLRRERPALAGPIDLVARKFGIDLWSHR
jgi:hypothetical protein